MERLIISVGMPMPRLIAAPGTPWLPVEPGNPPPVRQHHASHGPGAVDGVERRRGPRSCPRDRVTNFVSAGSVAPINRSGTGWASRRIQELDGEPTFSSAAPASGPPQMRLRCRCS